MKVAHSSPYLSQTRASAANLSASQSTSQPSSDPVDTMTYSAPGHNFNATVGKMALSGATPVLGALSNFTAMLGAGLNGREGLSYMNLAASGINLMGTGSMIAGLVTGNGTAFTMGLGMLGASGLAAGVTTYALTSH